MIIYSSQDLIDLKSPKDSPWTSGLMGQALAIYDIDWIAMRAPHNEEIIEMCKRNLFHSIPPYGWDPENTIIINWVNDDLWLAGSNYPIVCFHNASLPKIATVINKVVAVRAFI